MTVVVFLGPTVSREEARQRLDAVYLPPVAQGDIVRALRLHPGIIGIIDGYFGTVPAVWHKEILLALSRGVHVVGGASMGALRAVELEAYGMVGVGEIFEWYKAGIIDGDDEVALCHGPAETGFRALSVPLVNVRKSLEAAHERGVIAAATREGLVGLAKRIHYSERSYVRLFEKGKEAGLPERELGDLAEFIGNHAVDLKRDDALEVLDHIGRGKDDPRPFEAGFRLRRTAYLEGLLDRDDDGAGGGSDARVSLEKIVDTARLTCPDFPGMSERATVHALIVEHARVLGISASDEECAEERGRFASRLAARGEDRGEQTIERWAERNEVAEEDLREMIEEMALVEKMKRLLLAPSNRRIVRQLRLEGAYPEVVEAARKIARVSEESREKGGQGAEGDEGREDEIASLHFGRMGMPVPEDLGAYARSLGFEDKARFLREVGRFALALEKKEGGG